MLSCTRANASLRVWAVERWLLIDMKWALRVCDRPSCLHYNSFHLPLQCAPSCLVASRLYQQTIPRRRPTRPAMVGSPHAVFIDQIKIADVITNVLLPNNTTLHLVYYSRVGRPCTEGRFKSRGKQFRDSETEVLDRERCPTKWKHTRSGRSERCRTRTRGGQVQVA